MYSWQPGSRLFVVDTGSEDFELDARAFAGLQLMSTHGEQWARYHAPGETIFSIVDADKSGTVEMNELFAAVQEWNEMLAAATTAHSSTTKSLSASNFPVLACVPVHRVIVLTMSRASSLERLLRSLHNAKYDGDCIAVDVWIDVKDDTPADQATLDVVAKFAAIWPHGGKFVSHVREQNVGLAAQWEETWDLSIPGGLRENTAEIGLILEDDLQVSPQYWRYLRVMHAKYRDDSSVCAITLQRASLCAGGCPSLHGGPVADGEVFKYQLVGTWGFSPKASHWLKFSRWAKQFRASGRKPYTEGTQTNSWYKAFEKKRRCPGLRCMWSQHHVKYTTLFPDRFVIYIKAPGGTTMAANYQEDGLHYSGQGGQADNPLYEPLSDPGYTLDMFPDRPKVLTWKGKLHPDLGYKGVDMSIGDG
eukprot:COSAG01_NODE_2524_length_7505_cov_29.604915_4_plen_419_part_00